MKQKLLYLYFNLFGYLARRYIKKHNPKVIGFTGSIGKTSARMIVYDILRKNLVDKKIYTSPKNFNGELGMSLSILGIKDYEPRFFNIVQTIFSSFFVSYLGKKKYDIILLEYGIDHPGEMDFLLGIVKPHMSIVTKIDKVHSMQFETKEKIALEKYKLSKNTLETCFLNYDDEFARSYFDVIETDKYFYTSNYLQKDDKIDLIGDNYSLIDYGLVKTKYDLLVFGEKKMEITSNLLGDENIGYINIGCFITNEITSGEFFEKNKKINFNFQLQPSRFGIFSGINDSILIDGSYNASPLSMKKAIENTINIKNSLYPEYKIIYVLGDMRELGDYTKDEHETLADFVKDKGDYFFLVGESMKKYFLPKIQVFLPTKNNFKHFPNSKLLGLFLLDFLKTSNHKHIILFKGSQNTIFLEEAIKQVLKNREEAKHLCRQDIFWSRKKLDFFAKY